MSATNQEVTREFNKVAKSICRLFSCIDNVSSVAIGGSLARNFSDDASDMEVYVYYIGELPLKTRISKVLQELGAELTRSKKIFWYHAAWGHHTFFKIGKTSVELGYRNVGDTKRRIESFIDEFSLSKHGIYDTPFGHYESGIASCIKECIVLYDKDGYLKKFKKMLHFFPDEIRGDTMKYYFKDAKNITNKKIKQAVKRGDVYSFNACVSRVIRSLTICLFAINGTYFPGDKWNQKYLDGFKKKPVEYDRLMKELFERGDFLQEDKAHKYGILKKIIERMGILVVKEISKNNINS